jgi:hypothetical protein
MKKLCIPILSLLFAGISVCAQTNQKEQPVLPPLLPEKSNTPPVPVQSLPSTNPNDLNKAKTANPDILSPPDSIRTFNGDTMPKKDTLKLKK